MMNEFEKLREPLKPHEVEVRVGQVTGKGVSLLLYKTARTDARRLDEVFAGRWKREHYIDQKGGVVCQISIWNDAINNWVIREDVGSESNTEAVKGAYSDAFKRSGFSFGIGAELYDAPFIFVKCETVANQGGRGFKMKDPYYFNDVSVTALNYENGLLQVELSKRGKGVIYSNFGRATSPAAVISTPTEQPKTIKPSASELLKGSKTIDELKDNWLKLTNAERQACIDIKNEVKESLTKPKPKTTESKPKADNNDPWANL